MQCSYVGPGHAIALGIIAVIGCGRSGFEPRGEHVPGWDPSQALAPSAVGITSDAPLTALSTSGVGVPIDTNGATPSLGGLIPGSQSPTRLDLSLSPASGGLISQLDGVDATIQFATPVDALTPFDIVIAVSAQFPAAAIPACRALPPLEQTSCNIPTFTMSSADIVDSSGLTVQAFAANGDPNLVASSNTLPTSRVYLRELSTLPVSSSMVEVNGRLAVVLDSKLYIYDGSTLSKACDTSGVTTDDDPTELTPAGSILYFSGRNPSGVYKLFAYDGELGSVQQLSNTSQDQTMGDNPANLHVFGSDLYFTGLDATGLRKFFSYRPDPTLSITKIFDLNGAANDAVDSEAQITSVDDTIYLVAENPPGSRKLFSYTDIPPEIRQVTDIRPGLDDGIVSLHVLGGALYFQALNSAGTSKLFSFDPVSGVVEQISNVTGAQSIADAPEFFVEFDGKVVFQSLSSSPYVYTYDPSSDRVERIASRGPLGGIRNPGHMVATAEALYVTGGWDNTLPREPVLRVEAGTGAVTVIAHTGDTDSTRASPLINYGNWLVFGGWDPTPLRRTYAHNLLTGVTYLLALEDVGPNSYTFGSALILKIHVAGVPRLYRFCDPEMGCSP